MFERAFTRRAASLYPTDIPAAKPPSWPLSCVAPTYASAEEFHADVIFALFRQGHTVDVTAAAAAAACYDWLDTRIMGGVSFWE